LTPSPPTIQAAFYPVWGGLRYVLQWHPYDLHTHPVERPQWLADPQPGYVIPLSASVTVHDYVAGAGHRNIRAWIDAAAVRAGR
jgi:hypothetical protein